MKIVCLFCIILVITPIIGCDRQANETVLDKRPIESKKPVEEKQNEEGSLYKEQKLERQVTKMTFDDGHQSIQKVMDQLDEYASDLSRGDYIGYVYATGQLEFYLLAIYYDGEDLLDSSYTYTYPYPSFKELSDTYHNLVDFKTVKLEQMKHEAFEIDIKMSYKNKQTAETEYLIYELSYGIHHLKDVSIFEEVRDETFFPITFLPVSMVQHIQKVASLEGATIIKEQPVDSGKVIIYTKQIDHEHIYSAFESESGLYELGVVGSITPNLDEQLLSAKELHLFNQTVLRIKGVFGANAPVQHYYSIRKGIIFPFLLVDTGHATEKDLDGDGTLEIISSHGTPTDTYIYKRENEQFYIANVNKTLGAISVNFDGNMFQASFKDLDVSKQFMYKSDQFFVQEKYQ